MIRALASKPRTLLLPTQSFDFSRILSENFNFPKHKEYLNDSYYNDEEAQYNDMVDGLGDDIDGIRNQRGQTAEQ